MKGAFAKEEYSWSGSVTTKTPHEQPYNELCPEDRTACGICLMRRQMKRTMEFFNLTLNEMELYLYELSNVLNNKKDSSSVFSGSLLEVDTTNCADYIVLKYKNVFINLGNSYNLTSGVFTAAHTGVYSIGFTVYNNAMNSSGNIKPTCVILRVNKNHVADHSDNNGYDQEDSMTTSIAIALKAGDKVDVILPCSCSLYNINNYNTFSVFLLYVNATEKLSN
ncbi:hypothetical protein LDENG_00073310 [Lucifuga dentata]|nr:hypothetical protein LDENG_00073310 [Lucifuga dentata]